jgi:hypothetical protein
MVSQVLAHWTGMSKTRATWEDAKARRQHFPAALVWGQGLSRDGGLLATQRQAQV